MNTTRKGQPRRPQTPSARALPRSKPGAPVVSSILNAASESSSARGPRSANAASISVELRNSAMSTSPPHSAGASAPAQAGAGADQRGAVDRRERRLVAPLGGRHRIAPLGGRLCA